MVNLVPPLQYYQGFQGQFGTQGRFAFPDGVKGPCGVIDFRELIKSEAEKLDGVDLDRKQFLTFHNQPDHRRFVVHLADGQSLKFLDRQAGNELELTRIMHAREDDAFLFLHHDLGVLAPGAVSLYKTEGIKIVDCTVVPELGLHIIVGDRISPFDVLRKSLAIEASTIRSVFNQMLCRFSESFLGNLELVDETDTLADLSEEDGQVFLDENLRMNLENEDLRVEIGWISPRESSRQRTMAVISIQIMGKQPNESERFLLPQALLDRFNLGFQYYASKGF